jgi:hypothetical protein
VPAAAAAAANQGASLAKRKRFEMYVKRLVGCFLATLHCISPSNVLLSGTFRKMCDLLNRDPLRQSYIFPQAKNCNELSAGLVAWLGLAWSIC